MQLNSHFISNIRDLYGKTGDSWLNHLPAQLKRICAKRNLCFLEAMPNLTYHFVGLVEDESTGKIAIIKIAPVSKNIAIEARWFDCFTKGVPTVYWYDEEHCAFLMERLEPGNSLKATVKNGDDDTATRIICQTIRELQSNEKKELRHEFQHLSELRNTLTLLKGYLDNKILSKAESLFCDLTTDRSADVILHGDLHHDNILSSDLTWKVIDPHGYVGDPTYEIGAMIYNPCDCFPMNRPMQQIIERRLKILTEELNFDSKRIKAWAFCKTILSIAWTFEDHKRIPEFEVQVASIIDQCKL